MTTVSSSSYIVITSTAVPGRSRVIRRVASIPPMPGHVQIHEHHVGRVQPHLLYGGFAVVGITDDLDAVQGLEQRPQPSAHDRVVVDDHDADRCVRWPRLRHALIVPHTRGRTGG